MGYAMYVVDSEFSIPFEHREDALNAIKSLMYDPEADTVRSCSCDTDFNTFKWMHNINPPEEWVALDDALSAWRFEPEYEDNEMVGVDFLGEKIGDEAQMFERIAPYVEDGSYIHFKGEDGCEFVLWFCKGDMWQATKNGTRKPYDI